VKKNRIEFLTLAEAIAIHENQVELYGGKPGIIDMNLLSSALAVPQSSFDGNFLHVDIFEMAAAYCFHICQNHPFVDGYKRVALVAALVFLDINGIEIDYPEEIIYKMMVDVSSGKINKAAIAYIFRKKKKHGQEKDY